tara:strand:- start:10132 stop:11436 length:1305 start_codon:yes stop_codon:yes gene_type:complete
MPNNITYSDNLRIRSEEVQEILSTPPSWIVRWGITLIFLILAMIISMSFLIKYPDYISAEVLVTTKQPTERIMSRSSSQIVKMFVENGETVQIGQPLAGLKSTANFEDLLSLKHILNTSNFGETNGFAFPLDQINHLILGEVEPALIDFEGSFIEYHLLKNLDPYENLLKGNYQSVDEVKIRLQSQIAQKGLLVQKMSLAKSDFERNRKLHEEGVISTQDFEGQELEYLQMQEQINSMVISISQMQEAIGQADQSLRTTIIKKQEDETRSLKNLIQSFNTLKRSVREWEYNYILTSSTVGVISFQGIWSINQFVEAGDLVFSILPENKNDLIGKLKINPKNSGKIKLGQKVLIKLENYSFQQYGTLEGKVKNISISTDEQGNYLVFADIPNGAITSYNKEIDLNQELYGNAEIITENLSIADRLFFRFRSVLDK